MSDINTLYTEIGKYVTQIIKEQNIPLLISATVISYPSANNVSIQLAGSTTTISGIRNLSGQTLAPNDLVEVVVKNGDYSNIFIGWKR